jgi:small-conductance mechanosensitive channel
MPETLTKYTATLSHYFLSYQLQIAVSAAVFLLILLLFRARIVNLVCNVFGLGNEEKADLFHKIDLPLQTLLTMLVLSPFTSFIPNFYNSVLIKPVSLVFFFLIGHLLIQSSDLILVRYYLAQRKNVAIPTVFHFLILSIMYVTFILVLLDWVLSVNVLPLLATSTVVTAVFGFALQDTLRNIFAGVTVSIEKSFKQGDWISFQKGSVLVCGKVIEVGWRSTTIHTQKDEFAIIPNSQFTQYELLNHTKGKTGFVQTCNVELTNQIEPHNVQAAFEKSCQSNRELLASPEPNCSLLEITASTLKYELRFWLENPANVQASTGQILDAFWHNLNDRQAELAQ